MSHRRPDKRSNDELREILVQFDGLYGADGSARFAFGDSRALASISGPMEVRLAAEQASKATFEVIVRLLSGVPGTEAKSLSSSIQSALVPGLILSQNPRTLVQLVVQALSPTVPQSSTIAVRTNPSLAAALINASTLALINASSVPLRGVVCAIALGRLRVTRALVVDPSDSELALLDGGGTFAFLITDRPENGTLVWTNWAAYPFKEDELARAQAVARKAAHAVWKSMKVAVATALHPQHSSAFAKGSDTLVEVEVDQDGLDDEKMEIL